MTLEQEPLETPADATPPGLSDSAPDSGTNVPAATEAPPQETETQKAERARDDSGRFAKKETFAETMAATAKEMREAKQSKVITDAPKKAYEAPKHWKPERQTLFNTLADEAKADWLEREKEYESGIGRKAQEAAAFKRDFDEVSQVLAPWQGQMQQLGMKPAQAVGELLNIWQGQQQFLQTFRADPQAAIQHLAQITGTDVSALLAEDYTPPPQVQLPPEVVQQLGKVQQLEARLQQYENGNVSQTIQQFATAKDAQGQPLRPHFEEVRQHMSALLGNGLAQTLEDAYEQAVYANPAVRSKVESEKERQLAASRLRKAQEAKSAGDSIRNGQANGNGGFNHKTASWEDSFRHEAKLLGMVI